MLFCPARYIVEILFILKKKTKKILNGPKEKGRPGSYKVKRNTRRRRKRDREKKKEEKKKSFFVLFSIFPPLFSIDNHVQGSRYIYKHTHRDRE